MTHVTGRLTARNRDQLRNPTLGNRVWATFTFIFLLLREGMGGRTQGRARQGRAEKGEGNLILRQGRKVVKGGRLLSGAEGGGGTHLIPSL